MCETCSTHGRDEKCMQSFGQKNMKGADVHKKIVTKYILKERDVRVWSGLILLRTGISKGHFCTV
jgi:hypothetical protein